MPTALITMPIVAFSVCSNLVNSCASAADAPPGTDPVNVVVGGGAELAPAREDTGGPEVGGGI